MKIWLLISLSASLFFSERPANAYVAQVSFEKTATDAHPFGTAIHFRYDDTNKTAYLIGDFYFQRFRWSQRPVTDEEDKRIRTAINFLLADAPSVAGEGKGNFKITVDQENKNWKGFFLPEAGKERDKKISRFLDDLLADKAGALLHFPAHGQIKLSLDCRSLSVAQGIAVLAANHGSVAAHLNPAIKHVAAYWGYLPLAQGDAAAPHDVGPGQTTRMDWRLDLSSFKQSKVKTQLLYQAEGLVETGYPREMSPQYQAIHRCDLPAGGVMHLPEVFREDKTPQPLSLLRGSWKFRSEYYKEDFYLLVGESGISLLGAANFGEHGMAYYVAPTENFNFNSQNQLRFDVGKVRYYSHPFSPERKAPNANEKSVGGGNESLHFEGTRTGDTLTLRCTARHGECLAPLFEFKKIEK